MTENAGQISDAHHRSLSCTVHSSYEMWARKCKYMLTHSFTCCQPVRNVTEQAAMQWAASCKSSWDQLRKKGSTAAMPTSFEFVVLVSW